MPELPEVETVRRGLESAVVGCSFVSLEMFDVRSLRYSVDFSGDLFDFLLNSRIVNVVRRGKFLWFELSDSEGLLLDYALVFHLGMSGQLLLHDFSANLAKHTKLKCVFLKDSGVYSELHFVDQRIFGFFALSSLVSTVDGFFAGVGSDSVLFPKVVSHIARDVLDDNFDFSFWSEVVGKKRVAIKKILLDQQVLSGVGNIYADEALWRAKLHCTRLGVSLSSVDKENLFGALVAVMLEALSCGGTSFDRLYVDVAGNSGSFVGGLKVYGREGGLCFDCGSVIIRLKLWGRSCFFCPGCQKF